MDWLKKWEWTGFAVGVLIAFILWYELHPVDNKHTQTTAVSLVTVNSDGSSQQDKRADNLSNRPARTNGSRLEGAALNGDLPTGRANDNSENGKSGRVINVRVYLTEQHRVETVPLETYVSGVVAAEMPAGFRPAALEAQALAARTYIVRRLIEHDRSSIPVPNADVTDTQTHQVYRSLAAMSRLHSNDEQAWHKADDAARNTQGRVVAYQGQPIQALYFSASNGYTENSEEVFPAALPYLRSVASPWDKQADAHATQTTEMPIRDFYTKLGIRTIPAFAWLSGYPKLKVTGWTDGKRIKTLSVGGRTYTGEQIRDLLKLRSASFSWTLKTNKILITTTGNGHGVGMSQWGAEGMAEAGHSAEQIVKHYYSGTEIMEVSKLAQPLVDS